MTTNSMLFWYPKVQSLGIPTPETIIVELKNQNTTLTPVCDGDWTPLEPQWQEILQVARKISYPLFLRTDELSGKHQWDETCYVETEHKLRRNIKNLIEHSFMADFLGLPIKALVFRRYIPMKTLFRAFNNMPVNPEMRLFVKDGKMLCAHWYWVKDAIEQGTPPNKLPPDWKLILDTETASITSQEMKLLQDYAEKVSSVLPGFWSVDFCKTAQGEWLLIDMAKGSMSWHPDCDKKIDVRYGD